MPTVLRFDAYRVVIYTNDHCPAHVHVIGPQGRAIFELNGPKGPPTVRDSRLPPTELAKIKAVLQQHGQWQRFEQNPHTPRKPTERSSEVFTKPP